MADTAIKALARHDLHCIVGCGATTDWGLPGHEDGLHRNAAAFAYFCDDCAKRLIRYLGREALTAVEESDHNGSQFCDDAPDPCDEEHQAEAVKERFGLE